jgi:hypothetical protein
MARYRVKFPCHFVFTDGINAFLFSIKHKDTFQLNCMRNSAEPMAELQENCLKHSIKWIRNKKRYNSLWSVNGKHTWLQFYTAKVTQTTKQWNSLNTVCSLDLQETLIQLPLARSPDHMPLHTSHFANTQRKIMGFSEKFITWFIAWPDRESNPLPSGL